MWLKVLDRMGLSNLTDEQIRHYYELKERLIEQIDFLYESGASYNYIKSCLDGVKELYENKIGFVPLEDAINQIKGRNHNLVYLFLDQPLNTEGKFFDYLCEMVGRNTTVIMYTSKDNVNEAKKIRDKLIEEVGEKAVKNYFEYPNNPNDAFLLINCVIVDPGFETQRVYLAIRGMDRRSIIALEMPSCAATDDIVTRAENILNLYPRLRDVIKTVGGAA